VVWTSIVSWETHLLVAFGSFIVSWVSRVSRVSCVSCVSCVSLDQSNQREQNQHIKKLHFDKSKQLYKVKIKWAKSTLRSTFYSFFHHFLFSGFQTWLVNVARETFVTWASGSLHRLRKFFYFYGNHKMFLVTKMNI
jgi:hypothetical protein